jgi:hypothetical protein
MPSEYKALLGRDLIALVMPNGIGRGSFTASFYAAGSNAINLPPLGGFLPTFLLYQMF